MLSGVDKAPVDPTREPVSSRSFYFDAEHPARQPCIKQSFKASAM